MAENAALAFRMPEFLKILYLFGKSDIPVAVLPTVRACFLFNSVSSLLINRKMGIAIVHAGPTSPYLILKGFLWTQSHLLPFQVLPQNVLEKPRLLR